MTSSVKPRTGTRWEELERPEDIYIVMFLPRWQCFYPTYDFSGISSRPTLQMSSCCFPGSMWLCWKDWILRDNGTVCQIHPLARRGPNAILRADEMSAADSFISCLGNKLLVHPGDDDLPIRIIYACFFQMEICNAPLASFYVNGWLSVLPKCSTS